MRLLRYHPHDRAGSTLIGLPCPYVVPADGTAFQEQYYWDSFFTSLGLLGSPLEHLILGMAENLVALYRRFGVIPNASRFCFLSRSQPPFLTSLIWLAYGVVRRHQGEERALHYLRAMMGAAEREHETVWHGTAPPHDRLVYAGLSRYFDVNYLDDLAACESGWDHTTRCDGRWLDHLPVDLNAILYARERHFARAAGLLGDAGQRDRWRVRARGRARARAMRRLFWEPRLNLWVDYDWKHRARNPHPSLAAFFPLWAGVATREQAAAMVRTWLPRFLQPGGLVTTLEERAGRQWAWPNGWAPLQWVAARGLERYGFAAEARSVRQAWCRNCAAVYAATGRMWEKYNVVEVGAGAEGGLYGSVPGFGWSNAVFLGFSRRLAPSTA
jgi:alpha,alpha-trehalase